MQSFKGGFGGYIALPHAGGVLDQPEWLISDMQRIDERYEILRREIWDRGTMGEGLNSTD